MMATLPRLAVTASLQDSTNGYGEVPDTSRPGGRGGAGRLQVRDAEDREMRRRIPASQLGVEHSTIRRLHRDAGFRRARTVRD